MGMPRPHFHKHSVQKYNSHRRGAVFLYLFQVTCRRNWLAAMIYERFQYEHALQITFFFARHIDRLPTSPWKAFVQVWCKLSNSTAPFSSYKRVIYFWPYISFPRMWNMFAAHNHEIYSFSCSYSPILLGLGLLRRMFGETYAEGILHLHVSTTAATAASGLLDWSFSLKSCIIICICTIRLSTFPI